MPVKQTKKVSIKYNKISKTKMFSNQGMMTTTVKERT